MTSQELREYISKNQKVEFILEQLGMHHINTKNAKYIICGMPDGDKVDSTQIFTDEYLTVIAYTRTGEIPTKDGKTPNLLNLIMYVHKCEYQSAKSWCCNILGLSTTKNKEVVDMNHMALFNRIKRKRQSFVKKNVEYDIDILNDYDKKPHINLIKQDSIISQRILDKYLVRYDARSERIIFPHLKYDNQNKIVGIVGRTIHKAYEELRIPKYMSMLPTRYEKSENLYGLSLNYNHIKERNIVLVFEAEKSVMKADMFHYPCGVAVACHEITDFQAKLLINLDVEICICFDKDVKLEVIEKTCSKFVKYRKISYILDKYNLLKEKDSPVDRGHKIWNYLFKHRNIYDKVV